MTQEGEHLLPPGGGAELLLAQQHPGNAGTGPSAEGAW